MKKKRLCSFMILLLFQSQAAANYECDGTDQLLGDKCYALHLTTGDSNKCKDPEGKYEQWDGYGSDFAQQIVHRLLPNLDLTQEISIWVKFESRIPLDIVEKSEVGIAMRYNSSQSGIQLVYEDSSTKFPYLCQTPNLQIFSFRTNYDIIACRAASQKFSHDSLALVIRSLTPSITDDYFWFKGIIEMSETYNKLDFGLFPHKCAQLIGDKTVKLVNCSEQGLEICQYNVSSSVTTIGNLGSIDNSSEVSPITPATGNVDANECLEGWTKHTIRQSCFKIFKGRVKYSDGNCNSINAIKLGIPDISKDSEIIAKFQKEGITSAAYNIQSSETPGFLRMYYVCIMTGKVCSNEDDYNSTTNVCSKQGNCPPRFYAYGSDCLGVYSGTAAVIAEDQCIWNGGLVFNDPEHKAYLEKKRVQTYVDVWGGVHNYKWNDVTIYDYSNKITGFQCKDYYYRNQSLTDYMSCTPEQESYCYIKNEENCPIGFSSFLDICLRIVSFDEKSQCMNNGRHTILHSSTKLYNAYIWWLFYKLLEEDMLICIFEPNLVTTPDRCSSSFKPYKDGCVTLIEAMTAENVEITCARESGIIVGSFDKELKILLEFPQFNSSRVWSGFEYYKLSSDGQIEDTCYTSDVADSDVRQSAKCFLKFPAICYIPPPEKFCPKGLTPFGRSCVHSFLIRSQEDEKTCEGYNGVYSNFENINTAINFMARILSKVHKTDVYCIQHNRFCPFGWATYKEKDWSLAKCIKLTEKERNFNSSSEICLGMNAVPFIPDEVESTKNLSTIIKRDLIYVGFKDQSRNGTFVDVYGKPIMAGYELLLLRNSGNLCGYLKNGNAYINYNCHSKHQMICQMGFCEEMINLT